MLEGEAKRAFPVLLRGMTSRIRQAAFVAGQLREILDAADGGSSEQIAERARLREFCVSIEALIAPLDAVVGDVDTGAER